MRKAHNPDVSYLDEDNLRSPSLSADWAAKKPRRIEDVSSERFLDSEDWMRYLWTIDPGYQVTVVKEVKKADLVTRRAHRDPDDDLDLTVTIPAHLFEGLDRRQAQDVFALVTRDTYLWGMTRYGWSTPPPIPGGTPPHAARIPIEVRGITSAEAGRDPVAYVDWQATILQPRDLGLDNAFATDATWQSYLQQVDPGSETLFVFHVVDDTDPAAPPHRLVVDADPETGDPITSVETLLPAAVLTTDGHSGPDAAVAAVVAAYRWAAHELGWPPPPAPANGPT